VHVQFEHDINFTVALKNLNFSKDQTLAHFEDFSIYPQKSDSRASPPLWAFLSGMQEIPTKNLIDGPTRYETILIAFTNIVKLHFFLNETCPPTEVSS